MQCSRTLLALALAAAPFAGPFAGPALAAAEGDADLTIGGALRFQYSYEDYDDDNTSRGGDFDFDTFRFNVKAEKNGIKLDAEYRFYQYMHCIHHGWVGYDFDNDVMTKAGVIPVPFGNMGFNSHSFFFSSNYYLGLEDDYDLGIAVDYGAEDYTLQVAYLANDEMGGVDGYVDDRNDRYSYDATNDPLAGPIGEANTLAVRGTYTFRPTDDMTIEAGASGQYGQLNDGTDDYDGSRWAAAAHAEMDYKAWNVQLQFTAYEYDLDSEGETVGVSSYGFADAIPAEAMTVTANVAYTMPTDGNDVIDSVTFYNDFSLVTDKSAELDDTRLKSL